MGIHRLATEEAAGVIMKSFAILSAVVVATSAQFYPAYPAPAAALGYAAAGYAAAPIAHAPVVAAGYAAAPVAAAGYAAAPIAAAPVAAAPSVSSSQFRAEDEAGNTAYGYQNINNAAEQRGNAHGGVEGSYTFRDEAGVHTVSYVADDYGYRVTGRSKRSPQVAPIAYAGYAAAPTASREAILTTIKLNPGHAVFYRVD